MKGYLTNTELDENIVMAKYSDLWEVERSFRITKHDLEARPMFHRVERRIRAHICVCFAALKVKKELERQLKVNKAPYSTDQAIAIAERIFSIKNTVPGTGEIYPSDTHFLGHYPKSPGAIDSPATWVSER